MQNGFFVTGTDTGVGKTIVTGAIIKVMHSLGKNTCVMKPVETGCTRIGDILYPQDGMFLKEVAMMDESIKHITPYCFETPAAPFAASEIEGTNIDIGVIRNEFNLLMEKYGSVIVEGIGGIMVPVRRDYFVIDLIRELDLPLIVVSRPSLGTINHTLLTVRCAMQEGIKVSGIIINFSSPDNDTIAEKTNKSMLQLLCPVPVIGTFPYLENIDYATLERTALECLDIEMLFNTPAS